MGGSSIRVLGTRIFNREFSNCLARGPSNLFIVSPFVTSHPPWESTAQFCEHAIKRGVGRLVLVTRPPDSGGATLSRLEADVLETVGVDLRIRVEPDLHSKIYFFVYDETVFTAFIGSSNFTRGGFCDNTETMTMIQRQNDRSEVVREWEKISSYGAFPYSYWKTSRKGKPKGVERV